MLSVIDCIEAGSQFSEFFIVFVGLNTWVFFCDTMDLARTEIKFFVHVG